HLQRQNRQRGSRGLDMPLPQYMKPLEINDLAPPIRTDTYSSRPKPSDEAESRYGYTACISRGESGIGIGIGGAGRGDGVMVLEMADFAGLSFLSCHACSIQDGRQSRKTRVVVCCDRAVFEGQCEYIRSGFVEGCFGNW